MKKLLLLSLFFVGLSAFKAENSAIDNAPEQVQWLTIQEAERLNEANPRKIMVFFYTDWCGVCKQMEKTVFRNPEIVDQLNNNYYPVRFNAESEDDVQFDGIDYQYEISDFGEGMNGLASDMLLGQKVMPSIVFLDENKTSIRRLVGLQPEALFSVFLSYISEDAYVNQDWFKYSNQE